MNEKAKHDELSLLYFIRDFKAENGGNSPSYEEIMKHFGIKSKSTVNYLLARLENAGMIEREPGKPRFIKIVDTPLEIYC